MRPRAMIVCGLAVLSAGAAGVVATTGSAASPVIAEGVSAGGVDLSGLTALQAAQKIKADATAGVMRPLALRVAGKRFVLAMTAAHMQLDATATAQAALAAPPAPPSSGGGTPAATVVDLVVTHSHDAVARWVATVAPHVSVAPRNATLRIGLRHMHVRRARVGHTIDQAATTRLIDTTLSDDTTPRNLHVAVVTQHPAINANDLRAQSTTIVTVDRAHFTLRLFKHLRIDRRYPIAVGMAGLETPTGLYHVQDKQVNPSWHVPNAPWAGALAGQVIPPGPADPIVARWMGLADGVGIHGTNEPWSIGSAASHGCIRMRVPDVIALFDRVPLGTPVLIR